MKVYFLSSQPCALTLNSAYFGITDKFERFADVPLNDNVYAQFSPQNALPIGCFLTQQLRFSPPDGFEVYLLPDGLLLYARDFPPRDFVLKTLAQEKSENAVVTLFQQGELQLSIQYERELSICHLPNEFANAKIRFFGGLIGLETERKLALYTRAGENVFCEDVLAYSVEENILNATIPLSDSLGRIAQCRYLLTENACRREEITLLQACAEDGNATQREIEQSLLPFAFFESVLLGLDYTSFLSEELLKNAETLRAFLGEFVAVTPTKSPAVCGLVVRKGERLYEVKQYETVIKDGKIVDIRG